MLSDAERATLERWARGRSTPARLVLRSKIVLLAAAGMRNNEISLELRCAAKTICLWRKRFAEQRLAGIEKDAPRGIARTSRSQTLAQQILDKTLHEPPPRPGRWSTRTLAAALGTSPAMVQRVWKAHGLVAGKKPVPPALNFPSA